MGFNCLECGQREIWSFEAMQPYWFPAFDKPFICLDCFEKNHATPEERGIINQKRARGLEIISHPPSQEI